MKVFARTFMMMIGVLVGLLATAGLNSAELPFAAAGDLVTSAEYPVDVVAGDLNGDGRTDLVMCSQGQGYIWKVVSLDGTSFTHSTVATGLDSPRSLDLGDIDCDGDIDIIVGQYNDIPASGQAKIIWYENDGTGSFTEHEIG